MIVDYTHMISTHKLLQIVGEVLSSTKCDLRESDHENKGAKAGLEQEPFGFMGMQPPTSIESVGVQARPSMKSARIQVIPNHRSIGKHVSQVLYF